MLFVGNSSEIGWIYIIDVIVVISIEQDLRRILMIERRLAILSISYNQTSMNSLHTDLMTISSKGNLWCLAPKSE